MATSKKLRHIDPTVDCVAKFILGSKEHINLLIDFLNSVLFLEGDHRVVDVTISNPFNEKTYLEEKTTAVDIQARDRRGHIFHIEVQVVSHEGMPLRMMYYWSSMFSSQLKKGQDYTKLNPVISIWVVVDPIFPNEKVVHLPFKWHCARHNLSLVDLDLIHVLQLKYLPKDDSIEEGSDFWTWMKFFRDGGKIDLDNPPDWMQSQVMQEAIMALRQFTEDEQKRAMYFAKLDARRNESTYRTLMERKMQDLRQQNRQAVKRADQAEVKANQAETKATQAAAKASKA